MHSIVIIAAILFAGIGGYFVGAHGGALVIMKMIKKLEEASALIDAQSDLILDLFAKIDPAVAAELRANWEKKRA